MPSNFGTEYVNTPNAEGRKGGSVLAVEGILKSSEKSKTRKTPNKQRKNPTELSRDP